MVDNREKYGHLPWERNCMFQYKSKAGNFPYKESDDCVCHVYINNQGWQLVYTYGSKKECVAAVTQHNKEYKLIALLMPNKRESMTLSTEFGYAIVVPKGYTVIRN